MTSISVHLQTSESHKKRKTVIRSFSEIESFINHLLRQIKKKILISSWGFHLTTFSGSYFGQIGTAADRRLRRSTWMGPREKCSFQRDLDCRMAWHLILFLRHCAGVMLVCRSFCLWPQKDSCIWSLHEKLSRVMFLFYHYFVEGWIKSFFLFIAAFQKSPVLDIFLFNFKWFW